MKLFWFIPTHGDGRYLGTSYGGRPLDFSYLKQIACAVDNLGFYGALLPTGRSCEDAWITAASLIPETRRMRFLVAIRPGSISPSLAARMTATFDRLSNGRLLINVVTGGDPVELAGDGLFLEHDGRYELTDEFLEIWRALLSGVEEVNYEGKYLQVKGARNLFRTIQQPYPALYFGGSSDVGVAVAAKHIDHYLTWGEPPAQVATKIEAVRKEVARWGRSVQFGIRLHVIVRESDDAAWRDAESLISHLNDQTVRTAQQTLVRHDSVSQQRMLALQKLSAIRRSREALEVSPNLWAGVGLVRGGAGTALVESAQTVAVRIVVTADPVRYSFVASISPQLGDAFRFSFFVFALLGL